MRWRFPRQGSCGSETRAGLPTGRFYICALREGHRGDHYGRLAGNPAAQGNGILEALKMDRVMVWPRKLNA